ncbi:H+/K+-transporting ATPase chain A related protein [Thermoplasma acidophilum]|uniref:Potassium-transporting ATPase potassium-binding subunit n=1 Tax=Thermoplasma acidophilum (strain ATCC 25905 / DSM 1728 / JCM 9062 / NBRC 15155 / AMRC-C165) TaxID=273075 RepID=KDPA_THEAC|nr:potassium-transporting ATPase subunit KdpA [Thermoplasma acidophilum]P57685.1 RecName: Full=Potassium-transporting ATPase potassium-binding subunit; AltName: Full=ATP phosphohydrolase [potassium-transporting] A chain; AltName: Full=Potassium-binding and translocating subunit A; AltName: Full=Potassium-translocating ATPase A chain [Thermoplasma acidophilum DSM 1728]CAC12431.1 H+/K+-transporting ATPase chain A related protein [Thermoplasma acidophilum]
MNLIEYEAYFWAKFFVAERAVSGVIIILIYLIIASVLAYILSFHIAKIYLDEKTVFSKITGRIISFFERMIGESPDHGMTFKEYFINLLLFNFFAGLISFLVIMFQKYLPFSYDTVGMSPSLDFNTVVSFLTNTNLQHYSNPMRLSYFSQTFVITGLMFLSAGTGFAASMAFVRGIRTDTGNIGNFYHDFLVSIFDLILPLTVILTVILILAGIPETMQRYITVNAFLTNKVYNIPLGPVATLEAIKNIGTNGGGFYGANAAYPFENPDWFTNLVEFVSFVIIPLASLISLGIVFGDRKFGRMLYWVVMFFFIFDALFAFFGEFAGVPFLHLGYYTGNMVGKETAIGISQSTIFAVGATITSTGASNAALVSYTPAGIIGVLIGLLLNDPLGGVGTGVLNIFMYIIFTVFIASLMVGKLPEIMSLRISSKEIKYSTLSLITHPLLVVIPLGITLMIPHLMSSFVNPESSRITELLYEFASAASNNGSEMGGFITNQPFFNYLDGVLMLLGRYLLMAFQLIIAQSFSVKKAKAQYYRSIDTSNWIFGVLLIAAMILIGLLSYFPIIVLGPLLSWAHDFNLILEAMV